MPKNALAIFYQTMDFKKIGLMALIIIAGLLVVRFVLGGDEDTWLCQGGQWVKHGNPSKSAPTSGCGPTATPINQKTAVYKASDFEITYPVWSNIASENLLDPTATRIAVTNNGCNFLVTARPVAKDLVFKTYAQKMIDDEISSNNVKVVTKTIKSDSSFVESSFTIDKTLMYSTSNGYFSSSRQFYTVIFVSQKDVFEKACRPLIKPTIESVRVK